MAVHGTLLTKTPTPDMLMTLLWLWSWAGRLRLHTCVRHSIYRSTSLEDLKILTDSVLSSVQDGVQMLGNNPYLHWYICFHWRSSSVAWLPMAIFCHLNIYLFPLHSLVDWRCDGSFLYMQVPRRETGDLCLHPLWNLIALTWFHFTITSLVLLLSPVTLSVWYFSACWPSLLTVFQKILRLFSLRDRLFVFFGIVPLWQPGEVSWWWVQHAATWHWYLLLNIYIIFLILYSVHSYFILFKNLVSISQWDGPWCQHVLALCVFFFFFTGEILKEKNSWRKKKFGVCVCMFYVNLCLDWFCRFLRICGLMTCVQNN